MVFIDPTAASMFYQVASYQGLNLNDRQLKIGWGARIPSASLVLAVHDDERVCGEHLRTLRRSRRTGEEGLWGV